MYGCFWGMKDEDGKLTGHMLGIYHRTI